MCPAPSPPRDRLRLPQQPRRLLPIRICMRVLARAIQLPGRSLPTKGRSLSARLHSPSPPTKMSLLVSFDGKYVVRMAHEVDRPCLLPVACLLVCCTYADHLLALITATTVDGTLIHSVGHNANKLHKEAFAAAFKKAGILLA